MMEKQIALISDSTKETPFLIMIIKFVFRQGNVRVNIETNVFFC